MGMDVRSRQLAVNGVIVDFGSETLRTVSGHSIALRPQAFAVLRYLAEHAGQLATKDELMDALWSGLVVTDDSLVQCVHEIRRALQDDDRVVLRTAPKRGYRLVLPADIAQHPPSGEFERAAGGIGETWWARRGTRKTDISPNAPGSPSPSCHSSTCLRIASKSIFPTASPRTL
jgi:DNA-binding winged helix-turn-helix (wHTH) protein